jgi:hypothetical protein
LDLKEFQARVPEAIQEIDEELNNPKRIHSLNRTGPRKPATKVPRVSMQPLITEEEQSEEQPP